MHATGQVCHVDLPDAALGRPSARPWCGGWPGCCPPTSGSARPPPCRTTFDARFSATFRRYEYRVTDAPYGAEPLRRRDTLAWPRPLDLAALNAAAAGLVGEHDFAAYCRRKEHATTVREVTRLDWRRDPDGVLVATVQADAFCQAMVRSLVGRDAGRRRRPPRRRTGRPRLLTLRERASEVTVAPAHGLTPRGGRLSRGPRRVRRARRGHPQPPRPALARTERPALGPD